MVATMIQSDVALLIINVMRVRETVMDMMNVAKILFVEITTASRLVLTIMRKMTAVINHLIIQVNINMEKQYFLEDSA